MLWALVERGELGVEEEGRKPEWAARTRDLLVRSVDRGVAQLAVLALLVESDRSASPDASSAKGASGHAAECCQQAAAAEPASAAALASRGRSLLASGRSNEAEEVLQKALAISPGDAALHCDLGNSLQDQGQLERTAAAYRKSLQLDPKLTRTWYSTACLEAARNQYAAAVLCLREALRLQPDWPEARHNLGQALFNLGQADEAMDLFRQAAHRSSVQLPWASLATTVPVTRPTTSQSLEPGVFGPSGIFPGQAGGEILGPAHPSDRPLRIGYVSSFFQHDNWMKPVWALIDEHDRRRFEIHLFGDVPASAMQHARRTAGQDSFHDLTGLTVEEAADCIEQSAIDLLVDLNGYSRGGCP